MMSGKNKRISDNFNPSNPRNVLRQRAEAAYRGDATLSPENLAEMSHEEILRVVNELRLHQIELEMQNDELFQAQVELDAARERYVDLYDFAPVGYCTVSKTGLILQANFTAAALLGVQRGALAKQRISNFILPEDQDLYYLFHKKLLEFGELQMCEVRMVKNGGEQFWANLTSTAIQDTAGTLALLIVVSDITERKLLEKSLVSVAEERQLSIGQELHDNLGQQVAAIGYQAKALEKILLTTGSVDAAEIAASIAAQAQNAVMQCKQLAQGLLPFEMEDSGLIAALQSLASKILTTYWITCDFICKDEVAINDANLALNLYRIVQEAAHNAIRHGQAQHLTIVLGLQAGKLRLSICDDGSGFTGGVASHGANPGMGIKIMQYRAKQFGATLEFLSRNEGGIEVRVEMQLI